jgi:hypothetical protein
MKCPLHKLSGLCKGRISLSGGEALCATGYQKVISSCFAPQGQKQGKTELFMAADQREMHGKSMGFRDLDRQTGIF